MTKDDKLFWALFAVFVADVLVNHWHIRMLKSRIRDLEAA